jgi:hypothetical protein
MDKNTEKKNREESVMKRFWEWMKEKGYGKYDCGFVEYRIYNRPGRNCRMAIEPTPQMLIGYMLEYIIYKAGEKIKSEVEYAIRHNDRYKRLESIIKEMDGEE